MHHYLRLTLVSQRICFRWTEGNCSFVEIVDYHQEKKMEKLPNIHPGKILIEEFPLILH